MSWKRTVMRIAGTLRWDRRRRQELREEIEGHIEFETQENIERGMNPAEARRAAILKLGIPELVYERATGEWSLPSLDSIVADVRYALRTLSKA